MSDCVAIPVANELDSNSVSLTEGDDVELECTGWGWPVPHVVWTREDRLERIYAADDIGVSLRDVVTSYNATLRSAALYIEKLNRSDQLTYVCTVANTFGYTNLTIFVRVKGNEKEKKSTGERNKEIQGGPIHGT